jgi:hypothetical protein
MSEDECLVADWLSIGYEDGSKGLAAENISRHREACARYGVSPDLASYNRGRVDGLTVYCRPSNGFLQGRRGAGYGAVCPGNLEREFLAAYRNGKMIGDGERHLASMERELHTMEHRYEKLSETLADPEREKKIISSESTPEERAELLAESKELTQEKEHIDERIHHLERDISEAAHRIERMHAQSRYM